MKTTTTNHARKTEPSTNQPHANPTRISAASGTVDARLAPDWQTKQKQQQNWTTNREENVKDAIWNSQETENFGLIPRDLPLITVIYDLRFVRWKQYYRYKHHRRSFWGRDLGHHLDVIYLSRPVDVLPGWYLQSHSIQHSRKQQPVQLARSPRQHEGIEATRSETGAEFGGPNGPHKCSSFFKKNEQTEEKIWRAGREESSETQ
jgi:hypothetical protein